MQVTVTFRHVDSSEPLKNYAIEKTDRLSRFLSEPVEVHWVLEVQKITHSAAATVVAGGVKIKAHEETEDLYSAIDASVDKLEKQLKKHKEKMKSHKGGREEVPAPEVTTEDEPLNVSPKVVETENVFVKPMSVEEASMQLDVSEKDFLVFTNARTNSVNVLYRRGDGNYGLIETNTG